MKHLRLRSPDIILRGFTLVEVLIATIVTLMLVVAVSRLLGYISSSVADSRGLSSLNDQLRNTKNLLQNDLAGITAHTSPPPLNPEHNNGYIEFIEGPIGPVFLPITANNPLLNKDQRLNFPTEVTPFLEQQLATNPESFDATFDDVDDVLMFTCVNLDRDFSGTSGFNPATRGKAAEIIWFMRGKTLYRRVLILKPRDTFGNAFSNYPTHDRTIIPSDYCDISVHVEGNDSASPGAGPRAIAFMSRRPFIIGNSLGDLTKRENRFAHQPFSFPFDSRFWGTVVQKSGSNVVFGRPGPNMPTLAESLSGLPFPNYAYGVRRVNTMASNPPLPAYVEPSPAIGSMLPGTGSMQRAPNLLINVSDANGPILNYDPWNDTPLNIPNVSPNVDPVYGGNPNMISLPSNSMVSQIANLPREQLAGYQGRARYDDIVMTNVLSFDVKLWDPGAPILVVTNPNGQSKTLLPGDWLYRNALRQWITSPVNGAVKVVGFGAYVDLNYMWGSGFRDPYHFNHRYPGRPWTAMGSVPGSNVYSNTYETALRDYESQALSATPGVTLPRPKFSGPGNSQSGLQGILGRPSSFSGDMNSWLTQCLTTSTITGGQLACVYDTWSTHYERDGSDQGGLAGAGGAEFMDRYPAPDGIVDNMFNGVDDDGVNGIDDPGEFETLPPYMAPLRGIQIKIRPYEPDSKQVREFTVTHEFLQE